MIRTQRTLKFTPYCQVWVCLTEWGGEGRIRRCHSLLLGYRLPTDWWLLHSVFITLMGDAHIIPPLHQWVFSLPKNSEYHCVLLMLISVASVDQLLNNWVTHSYSVWSHVNQPWLCSTYDKFWNTRLLVNCAYLWQLFRILYAPSKEFDWTLPYLYFPDVLH